MVTAYNAREGRLVRRRAGLCTDRIPYLDRLWMVGMRLSKANLGSILLPLLLSWDKMQAPSVCAACVSLRLPFALREKMQ